MAQPPLILPNSVSSKDWSAAETNLDIVLIQFYRCKLCNNKFSSLRRSVIVAHMIQVHEPEWKAACAKVKELKSSVLETTNNVADCKWQEAINTQIRKNVPLTTRHFMRHIHGDTMVPRDTTTRKPWKRPAESKAEDVSQNLKISNVNLTSSCGRDAVDNLTNSISPGSIISTGLTSNVSTGSITTTNPPGLAMLSVKNGIAYMTRVSQPVVNLDEPIDSLDEPTESLDEPTESLDEPTESLHQPIDSLHQPIDSLHQPIDSLHQPIDSLHQPIDEIICKQCGFVCSSWNEHWTHSHEHLPTIEKVRYQCQACKLNFASQGKLHQHQESNPECRVSETDSGRPTLTCVLCSFETHSSHSLKIHIGSQHKQSTTDRKIIYCLVCNARFNQVRALRRHRKDGKCGRTKRGRPKGVKVKMKPRPPSIPKVIVCDLCNRTFVTNSKYNDHYSSHFDERRQKCSECDKAYKTKRALRQHMAVHKSKKFSCDLCDFHTFWNDSLKKHREMKHFSENLPYYTCSICTYKSKDLNAVKKHEKYRHREEKDYICETCGKSFKLSSGLKSHQETHKKDLQYPCDQCEYMASTKFNLYSHKGIHIAKEQMQFKCDQCSWIGRRSNELSRHKRKHSGDKVFYCHHCGLGYKYKHGLARHLKEKHFGSVFTTVEMSEPDESNIYTDDIIVAQVFEI